MPIYAYSCTCGWTGERTLPIKERNKVHCPNCLRQPERLLAAPAFKFAGRVVQGGGPDRFTADMLGVPLKDLPKGLKS